MAEDIIRIMCPNLTCRRVLGVSTTARGHTVRCRGCGATIRVPKKPASAAKSEKSEKAEDAQASA